MSNPKGINQYTKSGARSGVRSPSKVAAKAAAKKLEIPVPRTKSGRKEVAKRRFSYMVD